MEYKVENSKEQRLIWAFISFITLTLHHKEACQTPACSLIHLIFYMHFKTNCIPNKFYKYGHKHIYTYIYIYGPGGFLSHSILGYGHNGEDNEPSAASSHFDRHASALQLRHSDVCCQQCGPEPGQQCRHRSPLEKQVNLFRCVCVCVCMVSVVCYYSYSS